MNMKIHRAVCPFCRKDFHFPYNANQDGEKEKIEASSKKAIEQHIAENH